MAANETTQIWDAIEELANQVTATNKTISTIETSVSEMDASIALMKASVTQLTNTVTALSTSVTALAKRCLPDVTTSDNGKIMVTKSGQWTKGNGLYLE